MDKRFKELVRLYGQQEAERIWIKRQRLEQENKIANEKREVKLAAKRERKRLKREQVQQMLVEFEKTHPKRIKKVKSPKKDKKPKKVKSYKPKQKPKSNYISLDAMAKKLEANLPKSEQWFRELYESHDLKHIKDEYNSVFSRKYIGDVVNRELLYIIEIDGSIHLTEEQIAKDKKKDAFVKAMGFKIFRIRAYHPIDYINVMKIILKIRGITSEKFSEYCAKYGIYNIGN